MRNYFSGGGGASGSSSSSSSSSWVSSGRFGGGGGGFGGGFGSGGGGGGCMVPADVAFLIDASKLGDKKDEYFQRYIAFAKQVVAFHPPSVEGYHYAAAIYSDSGIMQFDFEKYVPFKDWRKPLVYCRMFLSIDSMIIICLSSFGHLDHSLRVVV